MAGQRVKRPLDGFVFFSVVESFSTINVKICCIRLWQKLDPNTKSVEKENIIFFIVVKREQFWLLIGRIAKKEEMSVAFGYFNFILLVGLDVFPLAKERKTRVRH